jgi:hypothetical protein
MSNCAMLHCYIATLPHRYLAQQALQWCNLFDPTNQQAEDTYKNRCKTRIETSILNVITKIMQTTMFNPYNNTQTPMLKLSGKSQQLTRFQKPKKNVNQKPNHSGPVAKTIHYP